MHTSNTTRTNPSALPEQIGRWIPGDFYALGTDGLGRSETREALRLFFCQEHRFCRATNPRLGSLVIYSPESSSLGGWCSVGFEA